MFVPVHVPLPTTNIAPFRIPSQKLTHLPIPTSQVLWNFPTTGFVGWVFGHSVSGQQFSAYIRWNSNEKCLLRRYQIWEKKNTLKKVTTIPPREISPFVPCTNLTVSPYFLLHEKVPFFFQKGTSDLSGTNSIRLSRSSSCGVENTDQSDENNGTSNDFHTINDGYQPNSRGFCYTHYISIIWVFLKTRGTPKSSIKK